MARKILCFILLMAVGWAVLAEEPADVVSNLSIDRGFGIGMQIGLPFGGLLSGRYWISDSLGVEAILFASGDAWFLEGQATARALYRVLDAEAVDLYLAGGVTVPFESPEIALSVLAGIEFGFRVASNLAWNIEFGMTYETSGRFDMAVGTGIHIYFDRPIAAP